MLSLAKQKAILYTLIITMIGSLFAPALAANLQSETRVLLCTSQGYQWVTIKEEQVLDLSFDSIESEHCVYCITSSDDNELAQFVPSSNKLAQPVHGSSSRFLDSRHLRSIYSTVHARAPPFLT